MVNSDILVLILLFLNIVFFCIGYLIGKSTLNYQVLDRTNVSTRKVKETTDNQINKPLINIDDTKIVTKINTDGLEKKYDTLGDIKNSQENIASSISKLKNMKG